MTACCVACGNATTDAAVPSPDASSTTEGPRRTPCPDVPKPNEERVAACEAKGGKMEARETEGCVRGYECVLP